MKTTVTAQNIGEYRIAFETGDCSRCGGDGRYGYSSITGNKCYLCKGRGKTLTRAGKSAKKRFDDTMTELLSVPVEDILPGDKILATFDARGSLASFKKGWRTVTDARHEVESTSWSSTLANPRDRREHPEDWTQEPESVHLFAIPDENGEARGVLPSRRGWTVIRHDLAALVEVWNRTLRLKGAWLVNKATGETIGAPTAEDKSAEEVKQERQRSAARRAEKAQAKLDAFLGENATAQAVYEFESDDESYASEKLRSMRHQLSKKGQLSPKQLNFAAKLLGEIATR